MSVRLVNAHGPIEALLQHARRNAWPRYASLVNPASIPGTPQAWTRRLLRCGLAAGPVFVAVFLVEGAVRDGYRPLRHPVSSLALGPRGWIQDLGAIPVFAGLPAAALACGWQSWRAGQHRFSLYSVGSAVTMLTTMALAGAASVNRPGLSISAGYSSAPASSQASPGSQPCPH